MSSGMMHNAADQPDYEEDKTGLHTHTLANDVTHQHDEALEIEHSEGAAEAENEISLK